MKKNIFIVFCITSLSFVSCGSINSFRIPGESKLISRNISEEYFSIAEVYKNQENYTKAIEYYTLALKDKTFFDIAYYQIALCHVYNKNWGTAKKYFVNLLKKESSNSSLKMSLAYIEAMSGNLQKAEKMYEHICLERPNDPEPLVNYINVLIAEKKYVKANEKLNILETKFTDEENIDVLKKKIQEFLEDEKDSSLETKEPEITETEETLFGLTETDSTQIN